MTNKITKILSHILVSRSVEWYKALNNAENNNTINTKLKYKKALFSSNAFFMCLSKCSDNKRKLIYSISTKDESKSGKVFDAGDSIIWDVDIMGDTLWIATIYTKLFVGRNENSAETIKT